MDLKRALITSTLYTLITAVVLGLGYPLLMLGISDVFFRDQASGELIVDGGKLVGSRLIGQTFTGPTYFHSRGSAAGTGYDAANSSGSNLAPTNKALIDRVNQSATQIATQEKNVADVPVDLVTTSGSGLDPDITPAAAYYQAARVAGARGLSENAMRQIIAKHIEGRQFGFLGEPRVSVLLLNRDLDAMARKH